MRLELGLTALEYLLVDGIERLCQYNVAWIVGRLELADTAMVGVHQRHPLSRKTHNGRFFGNYESGRSRP
jgi:hypothetical protein